MSAGCGVSRELPVYQVREVFFAFRAKTSCREYHGGTVKREPVDEPENRASAANPVMQGRGDDSIFKSAECENYCDLK